MSARRYACDNPVIYARSVQVMRTALKRRRRRLAAEQAEGAQKLRASGGDADAAA